MRLLSLPESVISFVKAGQLTAGHARALIKAKNAEAIAKEAVAKGFSVRQVEALVKQADEQPRPSRASVRPEKDADTKLLEGDLGAAIGMRVSIDNTTEDGSGELRIRYKSLDQLDELCRKLTE